MFFWNLFAHLDSTYGGLFIAKISKDLVVPLLRYETFCLPHFVTQLGHCDIEHDVKQYERKVMSVECKVKADPTTDLTLKQT